MKSILQSLDSISSYDFLNTIKHSHSKEASPIVLILEGIIDFESFSTLIQGKIDQNSKVFKISDGFIFLILYSSVNYFTIHINPMLKIYNYKVYSIFLKKDFSDLIFDKMSNLDRNFFYLYYEDLYQKIKNPKKFTDIKIVSTSNSKMFYYGFDNFTDLINFYITLISVNKTWPIFVISPYNNVNKYKTDLVEEQIIINDNIAKSIGLKSFYPTFNPFKILYYISFIEKNPPKFKRMTNVLDIYEIKNVQDVQISHLYRSKSNELTIRTFLGFETIFRCLLVFDYLSKNTKKSLFDIQLHFDSKYQKFSIDSTLFYLEIKSLFDSTILYSINCTDSFNLCNSTFLSFSDFAELTNAKRMFSSIMNRDHVFKDILILDNNEHFKLFRKMKFNENSFYIAFRMKNKELLDSMNLPSIFKKNEFLTKDAICSLNKKSYIIIGFNDVVKRSEAFSFLKKNVYPIKCYFPEGMLEFGKIGESSNNKKEVPLFEPKENLFYLYFQEYEKSKINYPFNDARSLFGIKNISDLQRNYCFLNDHREYTFIGFKSKENQQQVLKETLAKKNILFTNALNGKIFVYDNDQQQMNVKVKKESKSKIISKPNLKNSIDQQSDNQQQDNNQQKIDNQQQSSNQIQNNNYQITNDIDETNQFNLNTNKKAKDTFENYVQVKEKEKDIKILQEQEKNDNNSNEYNISLDREINNYSKKCLIGKGSYGSVYLVEEKNSNKEYAAKVSLSKNSNDFIQEIHFYMNCHSPYVLKLHEFGYSKLEKQPKLTLILEYMPNGSLQDFLDKIRKNKQFNEKYKCKKHAILIGIAFGMTYLHKLKIVHRDLKPGNILLDENFRPKISDFGTAIIYIENTKFKKMQEKVKAGSYLYMAPEIHQEEKPYSFKVDVYSFSMIAYEIITCHPPFYERNYRNHSKLIQDVKKNVRPDISMIEDQNIRIFLQRCWSNEPSERPDFDEIIKILNLHTFTSFFADATQDIYKYTSQLLNDEQISKKCESEELNVDIIFDKAGLKMNLNNSQEEKEEALKMLEKAASLGKKEAFLMIAEYYFYKKEIPDKEKAVFYYKKAVDSGVKDAYVKYGTCLFLGTGIEKDVQKAIFYYKKAAEFGNDEALYNLGTIYLKGTGVKQNKKEAAKYLKLSADLGNVNAMYQYAIMANDGNGIDVDYNEAEKYYKMAILKGDVESMYFYGIMLKDGSIPINYYESTKYLKMAADRGNQSAMLHCADTSCIIALFIEKKEDGIKKFLKQASFYYKKAADLGSYEASVSYSALFLRKLLDTDDMEMKVSYLTDAALNGNRDGIVLYGFFLIENTKIEPKYRNRYINAYKFFVILGKNGFSMKEFNKILYEIRQFTVKLFMQNDNTFYLVPSITLLYQKSHVNRNKQDRKIKKCLKELSDVKINSYNNYKLEPFDYLSNISVYDPEYILKHCKSPDIPEVFPFYFSNFTINKNILDEIDSKLKKLPFFIGVKNNYCFPKDINDIFTFYEFNDVKSNFIVQKVVSNIMNEHNIESKMQIFKEFTIYEEFVFFDESMLPVDLLQQFINFLKINQNIIEIKRNIFDRFRIATYINIKEKAKNKFLQEIRDYLLPKDVLFSTFKYPLQNNIIINEKMIFQDENDFDVILNEIESLKISPINVERNKLYMYDDNAFNKLFQIFSFICFKNETDKMKAVNHINSIVYKNKKNILQYKTDLHYATINEYSVPEKVRKVIVKIFKSFKGVEDIQRFVVSIESPIERTYIGFDSFKHLKKCYYKFVYQMNNIRTLYEKFFCKKKKLKYLMILKDPNLNSYKCIQQISSFAKDIQEDCCVPESIEGEKKTVFYYASFFGFETEDELNKAVWIIRNDPIAMQKLNFKKYKEGKSYVNASIDSREQYLFYNSL